LQVLEVTHARRADRAARDLIERGRNALENTVTGAGRR